MTPPPLQKKQPLRVTKPSISLFMLLINNCQLMKNEKKKVLFNASYAYLEVWKKKKVECAMGKKRRWVRKCSPFPLFKWFKIK